MHADEDEQVDENGTEDDIVIMQPDLDDNHQSSKRAAEDLLNDGRSHMAGQSRFHRFTCVGENRLQLKASCEVNNDECEILTIGQRCRFALLLLRLLFYNEWSPETSGI